MLHVAAADNALLAAVMRVLRESLEPAPIIASFASTSIYRWNPEKILEKRARRFPRAEAVLEGLPCAPQEIMKVVSGARPRGNKMTVDRFQKHVELAGKEMTSEAALKGFRQTRQAEAAEKATC